MLSRSRARLLVLMAQMSWTRPHLLRDGRHSWSPRGGGTRLRGNFVVVAVFAVISRSYSREIALLPSPPPSLTFTLEFFLF